LERIFNRSFRIVLTEFLAAATGFKQLSNPTLDHWHDEATRVSEKLSQADGCDHFANQ
jgi:hypothetical protein